ncbi:MAG: 2-amino-4-hydroxy-6-hydroxymethyldihydropteridine diphosphokinase [Gammaproteobacteria bacterium]
MPVPGWMPAYVGIGSNLDDPEQQVRAALTAIGLLPDSLLITCSPTLRNPALGPQPQPEFVNAVAGLLTHLAPAGLLAALLDIERRQGRDRSTGLRWGPRRIDLDLLVYGDVVMNSGDLILPHPGIPSRNFVLFPLLQIAPGLSVPGLGPLRRLAAAVNQQEQQAEYDSPWVVPATSPSKAR